jgi:hypothetical protein
VIGFFLALTKPFIFMHLTESVRLFNSRNH